VIRDGVTGILARSPEEWIAKLSRLIEQPTLRAQLGLAGRQLVESSYSIQAMAPRYIEALQQVASMPIQG
jgi:glycosyltransferase involved in cell wall biosynthesis